MHARQVTPLTLGIVFKVFASITRIVQLLVDNGFFQRASHAGDGRHSALLFTTKGTKTIAAIQPIVTSNRRRALRGLNAADIRARTPC